MVVNVTKISEKMKEKFVEYGKKYYRMRKKYLIINIRNFYFKI